MRFVSLELDIKIYTVHCLHSFLVQFCIHPTKLRINQHKQMITIQEYEFALCGSHVPTAAEADGHYWLFIHRQCASKPQHAFLPFLQHKAGGPSQVHCQGLTGPTLALRTGPPPLWEGSNSCRTISSPSGFFRR